MQKKLGIILISLAVTSSALGQAARSIDPMLGVDGGGNTFPGPSLPFGMIKPGPDMGDNKGNAGWKAKGDINGFSQTHVNGSGGGPKYGNILIQPTTGITRAGNYASPRADEQASVGYYRVTLARYQTNVEITTASRAAIYRFTYPAAEAKNILFDVSHMLSRTNDYGEAQTVVSSSIHVLSPTEVAGPFHVGRRMEQADNTLHGVFLCVDRHCRNLLGHLEWRRVPRGIEAAGRRRLG